MEKEECIEILKEYNNWRKGAKTQMLDTRSITEAIDLAIHILDR